MCLNIKRKLHVHAEWTYNMETRIENTGMRHEHAARTSSMDKQKERGQEIWTHMDMQHRHTERTCKLDMYDEQATMTWTCSM
jgi:hypothetical protein